MASAATAAVSARSTRGPSESLSVFGCASSAFRSSGSKPPSGPISTATGPGEATFMASSGLATGASSSQNASRRAGSRSPSQRSSFSSGRMSGSDRMPHCSAASTAFAVSRSRLRRLTCVRRVSTGCSTEAPISTAFWAM